MIAHVSGIVSACGATWAVVDVSGIGILVQCTPATAAKLRQGSQTTLSTSLVVREDSLTLYGFADPDERDLFDLVQTASGVGPKLGQAIVSVLSPDAFRQAVLAEDFKTLQKVPGVGLKGAQRLVLELKDRVHGLSGTGTIPTRPAAARWRDQVQAGLEGLGWSTRDAEAACDRVAPLAADDPAIPVGVLMKAALQALAKA